MRCHIDRLTEEISVLLCFSYWKAIQCESEFGDDLAQSRESKTLRRKAQIIFQDPYESLNPRQTVFQAVSEPLRLHKIDSTQVEKEERVLEVLDADSTPAARKPFLNVLCSPPNWK